MLTATHASAELAAVRNGLDAILDGCDALAGVRTPASLFRRAQLLAQRSAPRTRAWKARALSLNPEPLHNAIALAGMAPLQVSGTWMLAVAVPQPGPGCDHVDEVVVIDPKANAARVLGDHTIPVVAPRQAAARLSVHTDPKAWARDIALHRLEWFRSRQARRHNLQADIAWTGDIPSALLLDKPAKVLWSELDAEILDVPAHLRADVRKAVFAQARIPRVEGRA